MPLGLRLRRNAVPLLAIVVLIVPLLIIAVRAWWQRDFYFPYGDGALTELVLRDLPRHRPLIGAYSRYGWYHPGPWFFYVLWVPYALFGHTSAGMIFGALFVHALCVAGIVWVLWRRGGRSLVIVGTIGLLLAMQSVTPELLRWPWNPYMTVITAALFVLVAWETAEGTFWALPFLFGTGSFLVLTHVGFAPLVGLVGAVALVLFVVTQRGKPIDRRKWAWVGGVSIGIVVLAWLPPLVDQVRDSGNLREIADFQLHDTRDRQPLGKSVAIVFNEVAKPLSRPARWWNPGAGTPIAEVRRSHWDVLPVVAVLGTFAAALALAWRRRYWDLVRLGALCAVALLAAIVAVSGIVGPVRGYLVAWIRFLFVPIAAFLGGLAVRETAKVTQKRTALITAGGAVALSLAVAFTVASIRLGPLDDNEGPTTRALLADVRANINPSRPTLLEAPATNAAFQMWAVANQLDRRGYQWRTAPTWALQMRSHAHGTLGPTPDETVIRFLDSDDKGVRHPDDGFRVVGEAGGVAVLVRGPDA